MRRICLAVLVLLVTACGETTPSASATPAPEQPTSAPVGTAAPTGPTPSPSPVTPKGGTLNPRKIKWTSAAAAEDDRTVRVVWWSGVEPCSTLDRVEVSEREDSVTITLYEGPLRSSPDVACIEIAIEKSTEVALSAPLDGRKIVDGAK